MASLRRFSLLCAAFLLCLMGCLFGTVPSSADADFNADGKTDLIWRHNTNGQTTYWGMNGVSVLNTDTFAVNPTLSWTLVDTPDMNGDGKPDFLYQNVTSGVVCYWTMSGTDHISPTFVSPTLGGSWRLVCATDMNSDGVPDLLWQSKTTGEVRVFILGGANTDTIVSSRTIYTTGTDWKLVSATDLNRDGNPDLIFQNITDKQLFVFYMNGISISSVGSLGDAVPTDWDFMGTTDLNNDGKPDFLFQNRIDGTPFYSLMNGAIRSSIGIIRPFVSSSWLLTGMTGGTAQARVTSLSPQENADLYGVVRIRVKNLNNPLARVSVNVGGLTSTFATIAYTDRNSPVAGEGGAIDFRVPHSLPVGASSIVVSLNGIALAPFAVNVPTANPFAVFTLDTGGKFVAELRIDKARGTVINFAGLALGVGSWLNPVTGLQTRDPLYDGTKFHRAIAGFVRQGGDPYTKFPQIDPSLWGQGGPGYTINYEASGLLHEDGALAMARSTSLNSGGSQFYICDGAQPFLNGSYCVFGKVIENLAVAKGITVNQLSNGTPIAGRVPTVLTSVRISGKLALN